MDSIIALVNSRAALRLPKMTAGDDRGGSGVSHEKAVRETQLQLWSTMLSLPVRACERTLKVHFPMDAVILACTCWMCWKHLTPNEELKRADLLVVKREWNHMFKHLQSDKSPQSLLWSNFHARSHFERQSGVTSVLTAVQKETNFD